MATTVTKDPKNVERGKRAYETHLRKIKEGILSSSTTSTTPSSTTVTPSSTTGTPIATTTTPITTNSFTLLGTGAVAAIILASYYYYTYVAYTDK